MSIAKAINLYATSVYPMLRHARRKSPEARVKTIGLYSTLQCSFLVGRLGKGWAVIILLKNSTSCSWLKLAAASAWALSSAMRSEISTRFNHLSAIDAATSGFISGLSTALP